MRGTGKRILIVDDNQDAVDMLAVALTMHGFEVQTAPEGLSALRIAATFQPELAVLDIGLPVMDGYELAARLRRIPGLERLPLIAVTGYGQVSDRDRSAAAGFDHHLVKPVEVETLTRLARAWPSTDLSLRSGRLVVGMPISRRFFGVIVPGIV